MFSISKQGQLSLGPGLCGGCAAADGNAGASLQMFIAAAADRWMGFLTLLDEGLRLLGLGWVFRVLLQLGALGQMSGLRLRV